MNHQLKGKVVIITGASSGIGKACALSFSRAGASVVISGRNETKLQEVASLITQYGNRVLAITADVAVKDDCKKLIEKTVETFGRIDILVCNAGITMRALFADTDLEVIQKVIDTNFWGAVYCTKFALPYLLKAKGSIVAMSSIAGKKGLPGRTGYSASKFALEGFMETLRTENIQKHLHVLVACPGFTASEIRNNALDAEGKKQGESPRAETKMMTAEKVADKILKAVIKRKRDLVMTSSGKFTVMMNKFFPAMMDKIVFNHMRKEPGSPF